MMRLPVFCVLTLFVSCSIALVAADAELTNCNHDSNFDIVTGTQPYLTCAGLSAASSVSWSIVSATGQETTIAECQSCRGACPACVNHETSFKATRRTYDHTTLQFLDPSLLRDGSRIKCYESTTQSSSACSLFVVEAYTLPACQNNELHVNGDSTTPIECRGLVAAQNMYWSFTYPDGKETVAARCPYCPGVLISCPPCDILDSDVSVTREPTTTTLVIEKNFADKDGARLTCSKKDNVTYADCDVVTSVWKCTNGEVIKLTSLCDGNNDCSDDSDEQYCGNNT